MVLRKKLDHYVVGGVSVDFWRSVDCNSGIDDDNQSLIAMGAELIRAGPKHPTVISDK